MHILITGASGLIGKSLIHALEQRDYRISTLSTSKRSAPISTNVKTYQWNPNQGIIDEKALDHCLLGHLSAEPASRSLASLLGKKPILDLAMRLGEGSVAALSFSILKAAISCHNGMASFAEAGVDTS